MSNCTLMKIWICTDVWMDIFRFFDHSQLILKLALISPRFNALVDSHFNGREFTVWRCITIEQDTDAKVPKLRAFINGKFVQFPLPDRPLPNKIRFNDLRICYIDHFVLTFLLSNEHIWDKSGISLNFHIFSHNADVKQQIWNVFAGQIWPIFGANIRQLIISSGDLDNLRRLISSTLLADLNKLSTIISGCILPDLLDDDGPNATAGQALAKWLHTPRKDGQSKQFTYLNDQLENFDWVNNLKETFLRAITSASYKIQFKIRALIVPFELVNERTHEKLTLKKAKEVQWDNRWIIKRCPIRERAPINWEYKNCEDLNKFIFYLCGDHNCLGPLRPPPVDEEADQSDTKALLSAGPSNQ